MSIVNLQRDAIWTQLDQTANAVWSTPSKINSQTLTMSGNPSVYDAVAYTKGCRKLKYSVKREYQRAIGCYIQPPVVDNTPYRVKASAMSIGGKAQFGVLIGYAPKQITGIDDIIESPNIIPLQENMDELIMIPPLDESDPLIHRPIAAGIVMLNQSLHSHVIAHLSIQRLATLPPQFLQRTS